MIPLRDTVRSKTIPIVNYILIGLCGIIFLYETAQGTRIDAMISRFAIVPADVTAAVHAGRFSPAPLLPLLTSMFLHGGWLHLAGNMLYLYIFGDNVEDRLGHAGYLGFYVFSGVGAGLVQVYAGPHSQVPLIGASGAIAGVLGAYFLLYPRAKVLTLIPLFVFFPVVEVSAFFFLGFWFLLQFIQGSAALGTEGGGIAWWAHAGGFVIGAILLPIFLVVRRLTNH